MKIRIVTFVFRETHPKYSLWQGCSCKEEVKTIKSFYLIRLMQSEGYEPRRIDFPFPSLSAPRWAVPEDVRSIHL